MGVEWRGVRSCSSGSSAQKTGLVARCEAGPAECVIHGLDFSTRAAARAPKVRLGPVGGGGTYSRRGCVLTQAMECGSAAERGVQAAREDECEGESCAVAADRGCGEKGVSWAWTAGACKSDDGS